MFDVYVFSSTLYSRCVLREIYCFREVIELISWEFQLILRDIFICSYTLRSTVCENFDCKLANFRNSPFLSASYSCVREIFIFCTIFFLTTWSCQLVFLQFFQVYLVWGVYIVIPNLFYAYKLTNLSIHVLDVIRSFKSFVLARIFGIVDALICLIFKIALLEHLFFLPK